MTRMIIEGILNRSFVSFLNDTYQDTILLKISIELQLLSGCLDSELYEKVVLRVVSHVQTDWAVSAACGPSPSLLHVSIARKNGYNRYIQLNKLLDKINYFDWQQRCTR